MLSIAELIRLPSPLLNGIFSEQKLGQYSPENLTRLILGELTQGKVWRSLHFKLWDGSVWPDEQPRAATLVLNRPSALREMLLPGSETGVGEAYLNSAFDVEGDIEAAFELADHLMENTNGWTKKLEVAHLLRKLPDYQADVEDQRPAKLNGRQHSLERDRKAVSFHYNVSNEFYALWLDRQMIYSCGYFNSPIDDLESAQEAKLDLICRKLDLRPGQRLLDIGCGWGGLAVHAARHYGVRAEGITLSEQQLDYGRKRVAAEGLNDRVSLRFQDYRDVPGEAVYDAISSVGMVEHVGREKLPAYFEKVFRILKPGGLFLNHGIGLGPVAFPGTSGSFIHDYVFPDSELVRVADLLDSTESQGWEVRDVESLREHYALTLRHWVKRLEAGHDRALSAVNESTYRVWRLYMAGCAHNFQTGRLSIYQTLLAKVTANGTSRAPSVRHNWYCQ